MKKLFKTSKPAIAAILTLCILLGIAGTCVYAASVMPGENEVVIEETIVAAEETTQELVPVMAQRCTTTYYRYGDSYDPRDIDMEIKNGYLTTTCGISVNTNPNIAWLIGKYGPAQSVNYIPSGLYFYHTGGTHYVIAPASQMTEEYRALCKQIR